MNLFSIPNLTIDKIKNTNYNNCYGEVAQLARATGSYPVGREFESPPRYQKTQNHKILSFLFKFFIFKKQ